MSIVGCPKGEIVSCMDRLLRCSLVEVVHRRGMGDLLCLLGRDMVWSCHLNLVGQGKVSHICNDTDSKDVLVSVYLLVPLIEGSTMKKEVIHRIWFDLVEG
jgi:hypothetical protein